MGKKKQFEAHSLNFYRCVRNFVEFLECVKHYASESNKHFGTSIELLWLCTEKTTAIFVFMQENERNWPIRWKLCRLRINWICEMLESQSYPFPSNFLHIPKQTSKETIKKEVQFIASFYISCSNECTISSQIAITGWNWGLVRLTSHFLSDTYQIVPKLENW